MGQNVKMTPLVAFWGALNKALEAIGEAPALFGDVRYYFEAWGEENRDPAKVAEAIRQDRNEDWKAIA